MACSEETAVPSVPEPAGSAVNLTEQSQTNGDPKAGDSLNDGEPPKDEFHPAQEQSEIDDEDRVKQVLERACSDFVNTGKFSDIYPEDHEGRFAQFYYERSRRLEHHIPIRQRVKRARDLSFIFYAYMRLMEDRIVVLEQRQRNNEPTEHEDHKVPGTIIGLNRTAWSGFKRRYDGKRDVAEEHAIDVLVGDAVIPHEVWRDRLARNHPEHILDRLRRLQAWGLSGPLQEVPEQQQDAADAKAQKEVVPVTGDSYPPVPDRIRINGEPLRQLLEKALELDFKSSGSPVVLLRPFKLLVHNESQIRTLYEQLEQKFTSGGNMTQTGSEAAPNEQGKGLLDTYGTEQAYKELGCLIEFMDEGLKVLRHLENASVNRIAFSELWHIFQPGVEVITAQKPTSAYRVFHATGGRPYLSPPEDKNEEEEDGFTKPYRIPDKSSDFVVYCYQIDFDGTKFGPVSLSFSIQKFDGLRDITTLPIYPLKFAKDSVAVRETLLKNGTTFLEVCGGEHVRYRGPNLHEAEEIDSEIVVDFHAALWDSQDKDKDTWKYKIEFGLRSPASAKQAEVVMVSSGGCKETSCCENDVVFSDLTLDHQRMEDFLTDRQWLTTDVRYLNDDRSRIPKEDIILLPHRLFAFVLKERKWAVVDINNVTRVPEPTGETWTSLTLPRGHKEMVYSLVQSHFRDRKRSTDDEDDMQADLVRGKGKGLIILLHGAPGVGKTSTAECVAELCKRPLYPITCGDLGITAVEVESRLKRIFIQAQKWKCVLLLDEADVFLSEREHNVKHNSLVSVFLRVLEYYQGILFLTTNRVGKMDEAFRSRVHISLYYPPLDEKSTIEIFETNLKRTSQRKKDKLRIRSDEILEFAKYHYNDNEQRVRWNGRQIRNAFHIAVALAENEEAERAKGGHKPRTPRLRVRHFQMVQEATSRFDEYLTSVLGMSQAERARQRTLRQDDWEQQRNRKRRHERESEATRRSTKRYYGDDYTSSEEESDDDDSDGKGRGDGAGGGKSSKRSDSETPRRRKRKGRSVSESNNSDGSEQELTVQEKRDTDGKDSRDRDRGAKYKEKDSERERDRDRRSSNRMK
ncbi:uncharacterized protein B0T15DRAFT_399826 [Chaetomium strumarium]|uniref:AAA+ ATPase domain-containing protein n=1 Tax=Chaetomium strumarium TaxID=1170767 RepID=A0AAJ0GRG3_9PEZI|nr:hypothetical protein B0T15DRAFT_399826 [Chaetomium strumarium]